MVVLVGVKRDMKLETAFGEAVKIKRRAAGMTQEEFAEVLEMSQQAISRLERGVVSPNLTMVARMAVALRTRPSTLLRLAERIQVYAGGAAGPLGTPVSTRNP